MNKENPIAVATSSNEPEGLDNNIEVHELGAIDFAANADNVRNTVLTNSAGVTVTKMYYSVRKLLIILPNFVHPKRCISPPTNEACWD